MYLKQFLSPLALELISFEEIQHPGKLTKTLCVKMSACTLYVRIFDLF